MIKALSAPLKLVLDILDLIWDQFVEILSDIWQWHLSHWKKLGSWLSTGYRWCKSKAVSAWTWCINGLKSFKNKLKAKEKKEE